MKGIVLAGGSGSRLYPITKVFSKQLLHVYDKPMIYYPLSTLLLSGIKDILIITTVSDLPLFEKLIGDGSQWGVSISYKPQSHPRGIADAFILGQDFIGADSVCLVLGDNIFYGNGFTDLLKAASKELNINKGGKIFGYYVNDPERYGVAEFNEDNKVIGVKEKPKKPKTNYAIVGLYFYDNSVIEKAKSLSPSERGELEITDINNMYIDSNQMSITLLDRGFAWLDTGTTNSLVEASSFIQALEKRQGLKLGCLEEISFKQGYISKEEILKNIQMYNSPYYSYVKKIVSR
jgi:glucose-1-phosphate thymidylyltransferase